MGNIKRFKINNKYMDIKELNKKELLDLIKSYDSYIQKANDDDIYKTGWRPVCIAEYYDNDYYKLN